MTAVDINPAINRIAERARPVPLVWNNSARHGKSLSPGP